jgi:hypothetical protein
MVAGLGAHKGSQSCNYGFVLAHSPVIVQDAWPEIGEAPLTRISWIGQRAFRFPLYI